MYNIGIVDDNQQFLDIIKNKVSYFLFDSHIDFKIYSYNLAYHLLESVKSLRFDIVLLDIDMPDIDGISLAKELRCLEHSPIIIFLTSKSNFMKDAFGLNVFAFITKNNIENELNMTLQECIKYISSNKSIILKTDKGKQVFYSDDIICVYIEDRKIKLITYLNTYQVYQETISSIYNKINHQDFVFANRSCFANLKYISNTNQGCITFLNTEHIEYISREKVKEFDQQLVEYISKQVLYK